jgi:hypothetical protein
MSHFFSKLGCVYYASILYAPLIIILILTPSEQLKKNFALSQHYLEVRLEDLAATDAELASDVAQRPQEYLAHVGEGLEGCFIYFGLDLY